MQQQKDAAFRSAVLDRLAKLDRERLKKLGFDVADSPMMFKGKFHHEHFTATSPDKKIFLTFRGPCEYIGECFQVVSGDGEEIYWMLSEGEIVKQYNDNHKQDSDEKRRYIKSLGDLEGLGFDILDDHYDCDDDITVTVRFYGHIFLRSLGWAPDRDPTWSVLTKYDIDMEFLHDDAKAARLLRYLDRFVSRAFPIGIRTLDNCADTLDHYRYDGPGLQLR